MGNFPFTARSAAGSRVQASGRSWEEDVERLLKHAHTIGVCTWWRTPDPMRKIEALPKGHFVCVPTGKGPPDFVVLYGGQAVACEAKQTSQPRWNFSDLRVHQADGLDDWEAHGGHGAILLRLQGQALVVPWARLCEAWRAWSRLSTLAPRGTASLSIEDALALGVEFDACGRWLERVAVIR
jgi:hypothetical protein